VDYIYYCYSLRSALRKLVTASYCAGIVKQGSVNVELLNHHWVYRRR